MNEASNLINWAFTQTSQKKLIDKGEIIVEADVWLGNKPRINLVSSKKIISTLSFDQIQLLKSSIEYSRPIEAPFKKNDVLGKLTIIIEGKPNIEVDLVAETDVNQINPIFKIFAAIKYLIFGTSLDE